MLKLKICIHTVNATIVQVIKCNFQFKMLLIYDLIVLKTTKNVFPQIVVRMLCEQDILKRQSKCAYYNANVFVANETCNSDNTIN